MPSRRSFLAGIAGAPLIHAAFRGDALARVTGAAGQASGADPHELAASEDYWAEIQRAFDVDRTIINLNNGGVCPTPTHVLDQMIRDLKFCNESPVQNMWRVVEPKVESVRRDLARQFGCDPEEIAITRNASESLENLILGIDLNRGDEVIITDQNYPRMITTWEQRARREGIVVRKISFPVPLPSPQVFLDRLRGAITPRTRVIEVPEITNYSGQVLPVREIVKLGRERGIEVFVDGAHAFAHLLSCRDDLDCDYYGCSLHKWTLAPIGTGFLYVRRSKIKGIWPLMAASPTQDEDIRKFEEIGTHPAANHNAISIALAFHRSIGAERKLARLIYLRDRWAKELTAASPRVKLWTPIGECAASGGIGLVQLEEIDSGKLFGYLWDKHRIVVSPTKHPSGQFEGIRVTPNIYTTTSEIDIFIDAMKKALAGAV